MGRDYVYAIAPLLEDALMDRDLIHRQTGSYSLNICFCVFILFPLLLLNCRYVVLCAAAAVVKHMSLGVAGLGREDAMQHLLNLVYSNSFRHSLLL